MVGKKLLLAAAVLVGATSASLAQGWPSEAPGGYSGLYDYAPGYGYSSGYGGLYDYAPGYGAYSPPGVGVAPYGLYEYGPSYRPRGGPGPRVGNGTGAGIGAVR